MALLGHHLVILADAPTQHFSQRFAARARAVQAPFNRNSLFERTKKVERRRRLLLGRYILNASAGIPI